MSIDQHSVVAAARQFSSRGQTPRPRTDHNNTHGRRLSDENFYGSEHDENHTTASILRAQPLGSRHGKVFRDSARSR
jgi:hypothetical protein